MNDPIRQAVADKKSKQHEYEERLLGKPADVEGADPLNEAVHGTELVVETVATEQPKDAVDVASLTPGASPKGGWVDPDTTGDWLLDQYLIARDGSI